MHKKNKIEGNPILELAMIKRLKVKKNFRIIKIRKIFVTKIMSPKIKTYLPHQYSSPKVVTKLRHQNTTSPKFVAKIRHQNSSLKFVT